MGGRDWDGGDEIAGLERIGGGMHKEESKPKRKKKPGKEEKAKQRKERQNEKPPEQEFVVVQPPQTDEGNSGRMRRFEDRLAKAKKVRAQSISETDKRKRKINEWNNERENHLQTIRNFASGNWGDQKETSEKLDRPKGMNQKDWLEMLYGPSNGKNVVSNDFIEMKSERKVELIDRVEYLAKEEFLNDLRIIYHEPYSDPSEQQKLRDERSKILGKWGKLEGGRILRFRIPIQNGDIDFERGSMFIEKMENFFKNERKVDFSEDNNFKKDLEDAGLSIVHLRNARDHVRAKRKFTELIGNNSIWSDFSMAISRKSGRYEAQKKLKEKFGITFNKVTRDDIVVQNRLVNAINVASSGVGEGEFLDAYEAKKELIRYFNFGIDIRIVEDVKEKTKSETEKVYNNDKIESGKKKDVDIQELYRKMDETELIHRYELWIKERGGRKEVWKKWLEWLDEKDTKGREEVLKQLRMTLMLMDNVNLRLTWSKYWVNFGGKIVGDLGLTDKV